MAFDVGSVVQLKSGGPLMTVMTVSGGEVACTWFDQEDQPQFKTFPAGVLKLYEDEGPLDIPTEHDND
jgi:uncharacterized protein YodC (DUF2158 family)